MAPVDAVNTLPHPVILACTTITSMLLALRYDTWTLRHDAAIRLLPVTLLPQYSNDGATLYTGWLRRDHVRRLPVGARFGCIRFRLRIATCIHLERGKP